MQNNILERDIAELNYMPMAHLKELWQSYYNTPAPHFNKLTLINKLAYRMQELEYGGLTQEVINLLMDYGNGVKKKRKRKAMKPVVGTRLMREYDGEEHFVTVLAKGYEYQGKTYKSLSAIAKRITGTNWNGNLFFGLIARGHA